MKVFPNQQFDIDDVVHFTSTGNSGIGVITRVDGYAVGKHYSFSYQVKKFGDTWLHQCLPQNVRLANVEELKFLAHYHQATADEIIESINRMTADKVST